MGYGFGDAARDHHHAFGVAHHDVARIHRNPTAADRHIQVRGVVLDQVGRRRGALAVTGDRQRSNLVAVSQAAVGDDAGHATHHHAGDQDGTCRGGRGVAPAVDHQHMAGWYFLDRFALRVAVVLEHANVVQVFTRRDVAQGVGWAYHLCATRTEQANALQKGVAQAMLEE